LYTNFTFCFRFGGLRPEICAHVHKDRDGTDRQGSICTFYIFIIIVINEFDLGGTVALLLQDHRTMLPSSVSRQFHNVHYTIKKLLQKRESFIVVVRNNECRLDKHMTMKYTQ